MQQTNLEIKAPLRCKFFAWLAIQKTRLDSRQVATQRIIVVTPRRPERCVLCDQEEETAQHLLISSVASRQIWFHILSTTSHGGIVPSISIQLEEWWTSARAATPRDLKRGFDGLVVLVIWLIWTERNARVKFAKRGECGAWLEHRAYIYCRLQ